MKNVLYLTDQYSPALIMHCVCVPLAYRGWGAVHVVFGLRKII